MTSKDTPPSNPPNLEEAGNAFKSLCNTIAHLRDKDHGCPWDLEQDHRTLRTYMLEEAYEAVEALGKGSSREICDELGDVLLQVILNAQIAWDDKGFNITDVIKNIDAKMQRRHPHVFDAQAKKSTSVKDIRRNWQQIKEQEAGQPKSTGVFQAKKIEKVHPATIQALKIGKIASQVNFDWEQPEEVYEVLRSEFSELKVEWQKEKQDKNRIADELGDIYFSLAQFCRHIGMDPEIIAQNGNNKFLQRFRKLEERAHQQGINIKTADKQTLSQLWSEIK